MDATARPVVRLRVSGMYYLLKSSERIWVDAGTQVEMQFIAAVGEVVYLILEGPHRDRIIYPLLHGSSKEFG